MPEARRREVTEIAADLIVRGGRSALTVRNVAEAAGCSSTVVSHYFDDMLDLLYETYSFAVERSGRRIRRVLDRDPTDLAGLIEAVLPLDRERTDDWRIWFAFWSEALSSERFEAEQRQRARTQLERLERCLEQLEAAGAISPGIDMGDAAHRLGGADPRHRGRSHLRPPAMATGPATTRPAQRADAARPRGPGPIERAARQ